MAGVLTDQAASGLHTGKLVPGKVHRRHLARKIHVVRTCRDNRAYASVPFTVTGSPATVAVADYAPMWRVDRDYWIARITANIGKHDDGTHPDDGCPQGQALRANLRRVTADLSTDTAILASDSRLNIASGHHQDAINDNEDGAIAESDFNIDHLNEGQHVYLRVSQVGTTAPGQNLVVTLVLVPLP